MMRTEKEKALAGEFCDASVREIRADLATTHKWLARDRKRFSRKASRLRR